MHAISRRGLRVLAGPALSPDGRRVAYVGAPVGGRSLVYVASLGAPPHVVARLAAAAYELLWSPDGSRIAILAGDSRIFVVTVQRRRTRVIRLAAGTRFTILEDWSPDSKELLIAATVPTGTFLAAVAVSDAARREITRIAPYGTSGRPEAAWSPDGSAVAFTDDCEDTCQSLRVVSTQNGRLRDLHIAGTSVAEPLWASRPGTLVYAEERSAGRFEVIYLVDTRTGHRRRLGPRYGAAGAVLTAWRIAPGSQLSTSSTDCGSTSSKSPRTRSVTTRSTMRALRTGASGSRARLHDVPVPGSW